LRPRDAQWGKVTNRREPAVPSKEEAEGHEQEETGWFPPETLLPAMRHIARVVRLDCALESNHEI